MNNYQDKETLIHEACVLNEFIRFLVYTFALGILVHGYCYANIFYSHDSLYINQIHDGTWKISLGRFLQPLVQYSRGYIVSPWIAGALSLFWLACANFVLQKLFAIKDKVSLIAITGLLVTNLSLTFTNATYIMESDIFMLALFLGVLSVYIWDKYRYGYVFSPILVMLSCALYQAYFSVILATMWIVLFLYIVRNNSFKSSFIKIGSGLAMCGAGLMLYAFSHKILLHMYSLQEPGSYNGMSGALFLDINILDVLVKTYKGFIFNFIYPSGMHIHMISAVNVALLIIFAVIIFIVCLKISVLNKILISLLILFMPFVFNVVYFIAKGSISHELLKFSLGFTHVALFLCICQSDAFSCRYVKKATTLLVFAVCFANFVYSNQMYIQKHLAYQNTLSTMSRVISDIEEVEGYEYAKTPVAFMGEINSSLLNITRPGFEHISGVGIYNFSLTYNLPIFFENILPYTFNYSSASHMQSYKVNPQVQAMPYYPSKGSIAKIDGTIVVKFSD